MKPSALSRSLAAAAVLAAAAPVCVVRPAFAQTAPAAASPAGDVLSRIEAALAAPGLKHAEVGVLVTSLADGRTIYERNADFSLIPASNMKLLTSSLALSKFTPDYRFPTDVLYTGTIGADGTLDGDLYLRGSGDPSLTSERLLTVAQAIQKAGVKRITGKIVADGTVFSGPYLGGSWPWDGETSPDFAPIGGLNCDKNCVGVTATPGDNPGDPVKVSLGGDNGKGLGFSTTTFFTIANTAATVAAPVPASGDGEPRRGPRLFIDRTRATNELTVAGEVPAKGRPVTEYVAVEDPVLFTASRLAEELAVVGIALPSGAAPRIEKGKTPDGAKPIAQTLSDPFKDMLKHFLKVSDNLYGEAFLRAAGGGNAFLGGQAIRQYLQTAGVPDDGLNVADGSGLSRRDLVTPRLLVGLLTYNATKLDPAAFALWKDCLPTAGVDGTLRNRYKGVAGAESVKAKTGSLSVVSSLSGYVKTKAGEDLVFSILMNNYNGSAADAHAAQDGIVQALMELPKGASK